MLILEGLARPEASDDEALRHAYMNARYASNRLASMLALTSAAFMEQSTPDEHKKIEFLYRSMLNTGLPGVSPAVKRQTLIDAINFQRNKSLVEEVATSSIKMDALIRSRVKTKTPSIASKAKREWADMLIQYSPLLSYGEDKAKMLGSIPDAVFESFYKGTQQRLVSTLFLPLGENARKAFIERLYDENNQDGRQIIKAAACRDVVDA